MTVLRQLMLTPNERNGGNSSFNCEKTLFGPERLPCARFKSRPRLSSKKPRREEKGSWVWCCVFLRSDAS